MNPCIWLEDVRFGDVPTWVAAVGAIVAAAFAFSQLRVLRRQNMLQQQQLDTQAAELARVEEAQRKQLELLTLEIRKYRSSQARQVEVRRLVLPWQVPRSGVEDGYAVVLRVANRSSGVISMLSSWFHLDGSTKRRGDYWARPEAMERPVGWASQLEDRNADLGFIPVDRLDARETIDLIGPMYSRQDAERTAGELTFTDSEGVQWLFDGVGHLNEVEPE